MVRARATCLRRESGAAPRRDELAALLWAALDDALTARDWQERYVARHALQDRMVRVDDDGLIRRGRCIGIDREGGLRLTTEEGPDLTVHSGRVLDFA